jgi:hypothetical protein
MKPVRLAIVLSVLVAVLVTAVSAQACKPHKTLRVGSQANGKTVGLAVNGKLYVSLKGNPAKGSWKIDSVSRSLLKASPVKYRAGVYRLTFTGLAHGTTPIRLLYLHGKRVKELFWLRVVVS